MRFPDGALDATEMVVVEVTVLTVVDTRVVVGRVVAITILVEVGIVDVLV